MSYLLSHGLNLVFCLVAKNQSTVCALLLFLGLLFKAGRLTLKVLQLGRDASVDRPMLFSIIIYLSYTF